MTWALIVGIFGGACIVAGIRIAAAHARTRDSSEADEFEITEDLEL